MHVNNAFLERLQKKPSSRDLRRPFIPPSDLDSPDGLEFLGRYDAAIQTMLREESRRLKDELMDLKRGASVAESKPLPALPTHSIGIQTESQAPLNLVSCVGELGIAPVEPLIMATSLAFVHRVGTMEIIPTEPPVGTKKSAVVPCVGQMEILPLTPAIDTTPPIQRASKPSSPSSPTRDQDVEVRRRDLSNSPRPDVTSSYLSECQTPCPSNLTPHREDGNSTREPTSSQLRDATAPSSSKLRNPFKKRIKIPWRGKYILVKLPDVSPSEYKASKPWLFSRPSGSESPGQDVANPLNTPPEEDSRTDNEAPATPLPIVRQAPFHRLREQPAHPFPFRLFSTRKDVVFHFGLEPPGGFQGLPDTSTRSALPQPVPDPEHEDARDQRYTDSPPPPSKKGCSQLENCPPSPFLLRLALPWNEILANPLYVSEVTSGNMPSVV